jgi:hypothetical protein
MPKLILKEYLNLKKLRIFEAISENRLGLNESIDPSTPFVYKITVNIKYSITSTPDTPQLKIK